METRNLIQRTLAVLAVATCPPLISGAQTITDNFTDASNWSAPYVAPGKNIGIAGGRMQFTSTTLDGGGAGVARNEPLLSLGQDWSLKVDVHIDPFTITTLDQYCDIFLGFGKTGDWQNTHVIFEFDRGWWQSGDVYDIGDDVRINGVDAPGLFNVSGLRSPDAALRLDYQVATRMLTYLFDADGAANGYHWAPQGTVNLVSGTYNLNLGPADTLNVLLFSSSEVQLVSAGQACFSNLEITVAPPPPPFTWTTNGGRITITGYTGLGGVVTVPAAIHDLPVGGIGDSAFNQKVAISRVIIPDSVTRIGDSAFYRCYGLTNILLGKNVETIDAWAFSWCTNLPVITIPDSVHTLGTSAFNYCLGLASVNIPEGVSSIEGYTFYSCKALTNITIPDSVSSIGDSAFAMCSTLTRAVIGKNVSFLGEKVFYICPNLAGVYFAGNAPGAATQAIYGAPTATVYYLPGTAGWTTTFADRPTALWVLPYPVILTVAPNFGVQTNLFGLTAFGFTVSWASNTYVVVEATASLAGPSWSPVRTNGLANGTYSFSDPKWSDYPSRFYRMRKY